MLCYFSSMIKARLVFKVKRWFLIQVKRNLHWTGYEKQSEMSRSNTLLTQTMHLTFFSNIQHQSTHTATRDPCRQKCKCLLLCLCWRTALTSCVIWNCLLHPLSLCLSTSLVSSVCERRPSALTLVHTVCRVCPLSRSS